MSDLSKHLMHSEAVEIRVVAIEDTCEELFQKLLLLDTTIGQIEQTPLKEGLSEALAEYDATEAEYSVLSGGKLWYLEQDSRLAAKAEASSK